MKKSYVCIFFAVIIVLICHGNVIYAEKIEDTVLKTAAKGLQDILKMIPIDEINVYGFKNKEELTRAKVGSPIEIFTIAPDELNNVTGNSFNQFLQSTEEWYVPVVVGNKYKAFLTVTKFQSEWAVVGISSADLAAEFQYLNSQLPKMLGLERSQMKQQPKFVRIFQVYSDLLYIPGARIKSIVPFSSAITILELTSDDLIDIEVVISHLQNRINSPLSVESPIE